MSYLINVLNLEENHSHFMFLRTVRREGGCRFIVPSGMGKTGTERVELSFKNGKDMRTERTVLTTNDPLVYRFGGMPCTILTGAMLVGF